MARAFIGIETFFGVFDDVLCVYNLEGGLFRKGKMFRFILVMDLVRV